jgi:hypothetical protein
MRIVRSLAAFVLGLSLSCAALRAIARRNPSETGGMLEHLAARGSEYDLLVIGPSFVRIHFLPPLFDRRMHENGVDLVSFGFGMSGLTGAEMDYYIERILEMPLPKLKWVLIDVTLSQEPRLDRGNWWNRRVIAWHVPEEYPALQRGVLAAKGELWPKLARLATHARHVLLNVGNVGEGVYALNHAVWTSSQRVQPRSRFHLGSSAHGRPNKKAEAYQRHAREHTAASARLSKARKQPPRRNNAFALKWRDAFRARGVDTFFVISPVLTDARIPSKVRGARSLHVLDFNDPEKYPALYDPKLRYEPVHFVYDGAVLYTETLADVLAPKLLKRRR